MAFDAYFMTAVLEEIRQRCLGARVVPADRAGPPELRFP